MKYRREKQPDGSVKTIAASYPNTLRMCQTCEWCKITEAKDNEEIESILTCHLLFNRPYRVCGVYKWIGEKQLDGRTEEFVPTIPAAEPNETPSYGFRENKCGNYMPYGWHYEEEEKEYLNSLDNKNLFDPTKAIAAIDSHPAWILE